MTPEFFVMDLQIPSAPTQLALPIVAFKNLVTQLAVVFRMQFDSAALRPKVAHDALAWTSARNASFCGFGRNL